jgi:hypothetical protein
MTKLMLQKIQPLDLFILLFAFIYGNLFVITFSKMNWGILLIFFIVLFFEFLNQLIYLLFNPKNSASQIRNQVILISIKPEFYGNKKRNYISFLLNTFKRGFLLGFFIEAFKVGS